MYSKQHFTLPEWYMIVRKWLTDADKKNNILRILFFYNNRLTVSSKTDDLLPRKCINVVKWEAAPKATLISWKPGYRNRESRSCNRDTSEESRRANIEQSIPLCRRESVKKRVRGDCTSRFCLAAVRYIEELPQKKRVSLGLLCGGCARSKFQVK